MATTTAVSSRGTGVLDMARALREGRPHRAQGALGYHVLDTMIAIAESVESRAFVDVASSVDKPPLLPDEWDPLSRPRSNVEPNAPLPRATATRRRPRNARAGTMNT